MTFERAFKKTLINITREWHSNTTVVTYKRYPTLMITRHSNIHDLTYIHTYIHAYMHTYMHTYIHTCIHTYIHAYTHTYIHTCIHIYIHTCDNNSCNVPSDSKTTTWMPNNSERCLAQVAPAIPAPIIAQLCACM